MKCLECGERLSDLALHYRATGHNRMTTDEETPLERQARVAKDRLARIPQAYR